MRRADRLFRIIQLLRRAKRPVTAETLAGELETSKRSVYRDIAELMAQQVPIRGEAGLGYVLDRQFDMPPLMLTPDELEAAVLGAQWVAMRGDPVLANAARDLLAKITQSVPERLRAFLIEPSVSAPAPLSATTDGIDLTKLRLWIRTGRKVRIRYHDERNKETERTIWPVVVGYAETVRLVAGWCELRQGFRHFRTDRIVAAQFIDERIDCSQTDLRARWKRHITAQGLRMPE
ncbi:helix-turn-helix transcriptional regulator [Nannocystis pusilla]|uniref:helix-turn-helix transcriptional regulator n=1 Tax=Nannocystis pusilla TaxID=889268 RepID=UPI003BF38FBA